MTTAKTHTIEYTDLDDVLRGTGIDPQEYANETGTIILVDEDAAEAGWNCWYGVTGETDPRKIREHYLASGGTPSHIYLPAMRAK